MVMVNGYWLFGQCLVQFEQFGDAGGFGHGGGESVCSHHGAVVLAVGSTQFGRHRHFVVEVGEGAVGVLGTSVKDSLCGGFDAGTLFVFYCQQCSIAVGVENIRLDWLVNRELINQFQVKHQTQLFVIALRMNLCLIAYTRNLYQIYILYTFTFYIYLQIYSPFVSPESDSGLMDGVHISSAIVFISTHSARLTCFLPASYSHGLNIRTCFRATASKRLSCGL